MKILTFNSGEGYDYASEIGEFTVNATVNKEFTILKEAIAYYENLNEEKALWDHTGGA